MEVRRRNIRALGARVRQPGSRSDANGAPHPDPAAYAKEFSGKHEHRTLTGGIGHNLPQEAPQAFAQAIIDVGKL